MTEHREGSFFDKVKDVLGMGGHDEEHPHDKPTEPMHDMDDMHEPVSTVGMDAPVDDGMADSVNRPAGPDYGATDTTDTTDTDLGRDFGDEDPRPPAV